MNRYRTSAVLCFALLWPLAPSQGLPETNRKIIEEGEKRNQARLHIRHLCKKIGPRLTGSDRYDAASRWAAKKFQDWGLKNVRLEPFLDVPYGFNRGPRQVGRMVVPERRDFQFTTLAWSVGTRGSVRGRAMPEPSTEEELEQAKEALKGAWVLPAGPGMTLERRPNEERQGLRKKVEECGIAGWVYASASELVTTHGNMKIDTLEALSKVPRIIVRASDMKTVRDALARGEKPELEFDIDNRFDRRNVTVSNVVADIPGTEKPDEYVIFGAHLDSWDGPGSEGASDNATGCTAILEAARILAKFNVKPKRTIRFILFGGEEQGLLGSKAYVEQHEKELGKISAVFVDDGGTNYNSGLTCSESAAKLLMDAAEPLKLTDPSYEFRITTYKPSGSPSRRSGGSDHAPFVEKGVPAYFMRKTGTANYMEIWHSQNDNLSRVNVKHVGRSALVFAVLGYNLACADGLVARD